MKVVILCGGKGTRLREETEFKPKPLVEIGNLPILWHIMKHYEVHNHNDFVLCLGHKGNMIKEFFVNYEWDAFDFTLNLRSKEKDYHRSYEEEDWNITFANTGYKTGTAGRIQAIKKFITDDLFLVTYGDGVSDVDITKLVAFHKEQGKLATLTGVHPAGKYGLLKVEENTITGFNEKKPTNDLINGGFMVLDKKVFDMIEEDCMFEEVILPKLAQDGQLAIFKHNGFWHSMDTHKDFLDLNKMWQESAPWKTWNDHPNR
ncbi:MAG: glucose-1-phosphate cytidylyltransferase [Candidatus Woesearchaeota archaeon]|nr:glucose-1-phosphate cytidylyltransferase [Candidatus Woesearchaeota archaeon]